MNAPSAVFLILIAVLLQTAVFNNLWPWGISPNIVLVSVVYLALTSKRRTVVIAALFAGLLLDILSSSIFGIYLLIFIFISEFFLFARTFIFAKINLIILLFAVLLGTVFYEILSAILNGLAFFLEAQSFAYSIRDLIFLAPKEIIYNLAITAIFFILTKIFSRIFRNDKPLTPLIKR
jgi:rod shape-determining protein MreD